ncbi:MAG: hypothetical protein KA293_12400, partial [Bacteroidia bacterium]|nr:hypothetical protein [Bacteroidia bacterium]
MNSAGPNRRGNAPSSNSGLKWAERLPRTSRARWVMIAVFILITAFILPKDFVAEYNYELGKPWLAAELKSDFDFAIYKPQSQFEDEKRLAKESVPPVFILDSTVVMRTWIAAAAAIERSFSDFLAYREAGTGPEQIELRQHIQDKYGVDPELSLADHEDLRSWKVTFANKADAFVKEVYTAGLTDTSKSAFTTDLIYVRKSETRLVQKALALSTSELPEFLNSSHPGLEPAERRLLRATILPLMRPNLRFDTKATEAEQLRAVQRVSAVTDKVAKGETIISKGERVNEVHEGKIKSYVLARAERYGRTPYFVTLSGQLVIVTILTMLLVLFIR